MEIETAWFIIVTVMLAMYVVLDGFDFGVGMVYPFVAHTEADRQNGASPQSVRCGTRMRCG